MSSGNSGRKVGPEVDDYNRYYSTKSEDILQQVGFQTLIATFKIYGYKLDHDTDKCKLYRPSAIFRIAVALVGCIMNAIELIYKPYIKGELHLEYICFMMLVVMTSYGNLLTTLHTCLHWQKYNLLIRDMVDTLLDITPPRKRHYYVKRIKILTIVLIAIAVVDTTYKISTYFYNITYSDRKKMSSLLYDPEYEFLMYLQVAIVVFLKLNNSFYIVYQGLLILVCHLLNVYFDHYLMDANCQTPTTQRQNQHRKLCRFVNQANELFSSYLLYSAITETVCVITAVKAIQFYSGIKVSASFTVLYNIINTVHFVSKVLLCSAVNNKV